MNHAEQIMAELRAAGSEEKRRVLMSFFKTGRGDYAECDRFMGVAVPATRRIMSRHLDASPSVVAQLLASPWHEARFAALVVLTERFRCANEAGRSAIYDFYLRHLAGVNNWDLVDVSAAAIVGTHLLDKSPAPLYALADSARMWDNRIAIVATHAFIRCGRLELTFLLADRMMHHPHDLMHKAIGWMLREAGKKDAARLTDYVEKRRRDMPRTMLRYATERMPADVRRHLMAR